ncbi:MAG: N-acetylglucosaminyldiphosphodolichol N-acetylglucosaminyltransferase catalytic subunit alg13 [Watsoniomyces obsoletus]|nr:MAG: N-acetylglucosaminyldiphosphodolichol N-acetylglucosaminyltransferase catalytic subunit alg13 [Watsoniomyces obsoletus]
MSYSADQDEGPESTSSSAAVGAGTAGAAVAVVGNSEFTSSSVPAGATIKARGGGKSRAATGKERDDKERDSRPLLEPFPPPPPDFLIRRQQEAKEAKEKEDRLRLEQLPSSQPIHQREEHHLQQSQHQKKNQNQQGQQGRGQGQQGQKQQGQGTKGQQGQEQTHQAQQTPGIIALRPLHFLQRQDGSFVPLIPADELPPSIELKEIPQKTTTDMSNMSGMISLGMIPRMTGRYYTLVNSNINNINDGNNNNNGNNNGNVKVNVKDNNKDGKGVAGGNGKGMIDDNEEEFQSAGEGEMDVILEMDEGGSFSPMEGPAYGPGPIVGKHGPVSAVAAGKRRVMVLDLEQELAATARGGPEKKLGNYSSSAMGMGTGMVVASSSGNTIQGIAKVSISK